MLSHHKLNYLLRNNHTLKKHNQRLRDNYFFQFFDYIEQLEQENYPFFYPEVHKLKLMEKSQIDGIENNIELSVNPLKVICIVSNNTKDSTEKTAERRRQKFLYILNESGKINEYRYNGKKNFEELLLSFDPLGRFVVQVSKGIAANVRFYRFNGSKQLCFYNPKLINEIFQHIKELNLNTSKQSLIFIKNFRTIKDIYFHKLLLQKNLFRYITE
jgi:hypothetical protein